jgi:hypothetical protein
MRAIGYFDSPDRLDRASQEAARAGWLTIEVFSPACDERLLQIAGATRSPVAITAVGGGVLGLLGGIVLTVGTVRQWPGLIVGGKPLVSMPPFLIIMFELAVLMAAIGAAWSFLAASARARRRAATVPDPVTTDNQFALLIEAPHETGELAESFFERTGATGWRRA